MVPRTTTPCAHCAAPHRSLFCPRRGETASRLGESGFARRFRRGQVLFGAGDPPESLYVIRTGRVRVYSHTEDGDEQVLRLLGPGEIVGYRPVLANEPYNATAEAMEPSEICVIPADAAYARLRAEPELAMAMLAKMARELRLSEELMMELLHRPVGQRVAGLVVSLLEGGAAGARPLTLAARDLPRREMARMVGTTPETLSRALRRMARDGLLVVTRALVRVRDLDRLRRYAREGRAAN